VGRPDQDHTLPLISPVLDVLLAWVVTRATLPLAGPRAAGKKQVAAVSILLLMTLVGYAFLENFTYRY
jgi:hypothetical protein